MRRTTEPTVSPERTLEIPAGSDAPLRSYLAARHALAALLRETALVLDQAAPWARERAHDLLVRLAEDRFQLVVVGQFKRGKSTLINAMVHEALLPVGVVPVTSVVTTLRYGSSIRAIVQRAGRLLDDDVPVAQLPEFITEQGNPANHKQVLSAEIEVPAPFLRRGVWLVDTPGIGSAHEANTATTLAYIPEADAAIFVTGADAPLSAGELDFLDSVREHVRKLFIVVNKIDQVANDERAVLLDFTERVLRDRLGVDRVPLYAVSARGALEDDAPDGRSGEGVDQLQAALAAFLEQERQQAHLVSVLDRAVRLLDEIRAAGEAPAHGAPPRTDPSERTALASRIDDFWRRLSVARDALLRSEPLPQVELPVAPPNTVAPARGETAIEESRPARERRVPAQTCPVCVAMWNAVFDFMCQHQYAIATERTAQRQFVASQGLCPAHTWQLERLGSPRGLSLTYPALIDHTAARLRGAHGLPPRRVATMIDELLSRADVCPACATARRRERAAIRDLASTLGDPRAAAAFVRSTVLCLPHLRMLLEGVDDAVGAAVLDAQVHRLADVAEAMREYVLKIDARRRHLLTGEESRAYRQALVMLTGEPKA